MLKQLMRVRLDEVESDQLMIRRAFANFPSGVAALAVELNGEKHVVVASSFMVGVSLEPCLVAVALQKSSTTWPVLRQSDTIGISVFSSEQTRLVRQLAGRDRSRRFDQVGTEMKGTGGVYIVDASMWLETRVHSELDAGDHWMVLLEVSAVGVDDLQEPLLWHGSKFRAITDTPSSKADAMSPGNGCVPHARPPRDTSSSSSPHS